MEQAFLCIFWHISCLKIKCNTEAGKNYMLQLWSQQRLLSMLALSAMFSLALCFKDCQQRQGMEMVGLCLGVLLLAFREYVISERDWKTQVITPP